MASKKLSQSDIEVLGTFRNFSSTGGATVTRTAVSSARVGGKNIGATEHGLSRLKIKGYLREKSRGQFSVTTLGLEVLDREFDRYRV